MCLHFANFRYHHLTVSFLCNHLFIKSYLFFFWLILSLFLLFKCIFYFCYCKFIIYKHYLQIICLLFSPILFVPALFSLIFYAIYHRCRRCCRPWAREADLPWGDPWEKKLDLSSPKSVWSGLTTSSRLNPPSTSARELFSRDPAILQGLRELLDVEVRAAFGRLGSSFENSTFVPAASHSGVTAVVINPSSGDEIVREEDIINDNQEF